MQTRRFLSYHKEGRFEDCSLMIYEKGTLVAVCPACVCFEKNEKMFISHKGSTYGGVVFSDSLRRLEKIVEVIKEIEYYLVQRDYTKTIIKPTLRLLCKKQDDVLPFALNILGYTENHELNLFIDYDNYNSTITSNFSKLKKRQVNKCVNIGMTFRPLEKMEEIKDFHDVLSENLLKFDAKPVHTVDELLDLKQNRFPEYIRFFGAFLDNQLVAGTMVFDFLQVKCAHTQYLASKLIKNNISPMSFIYYKTAQLYMDLNYRYLSWGIATEHFGQGVNWGLMRNKEEFGSSHCFNTIYIKQLT